MTISMAGRRALVTGANKGIGRAVALVLAAEGAKVAIHYGRDVKAAEAVRRELAGNGHALLDCDLADPAGAAALADRAAAALDGLDIVVNNAGVYTRHDLHDADWLETWNHTLAVNLTAPALVIAGALPHLERSERAHIVNISSRGAYRGEPEGPGYGASKAGLNALTQSLAQALAPRHIVVVGVAPGWVLTDMTRSYLEGPEGDAIRAQSPAGRVATAAEVAAVVALAVSGRADALQGAILDVNCASYLR